MSFLNIAAYRFVSLDNLPQLRERLLAEANRLQLYGTILLAPEGINLFLAAPASAIHEFVQWLQNDARLAGLDIKYSESETIPFRRMRVRVKREIIRMNHPTIRPESGRAPVVDAQTLQRWLESGRDDDGNDIVLVDTRNDFEVDAGTFEGAIDFRIQRFTQFPEAVVANREQLEGKTVVTFCTGGIRCEKAAIYMAEAGIDNVYQLEGGILKYFEEAGSAGWQGNCFVFDDRIALNPELEPVGPDADEPAISSN